MQNSINGIFSLFLQLFRLFDIYNNDRVCRALGGESLSSIPDTKAEDSQSLYDFAEAKSILEKTIENMEHVIVGKRELLEVTLVALLAKGHILLEDVPGVGKTMLVRTLAKSLACQFTRIQFTPDLLPSDITGVSLYNQKSQEFEFRPGPIVGEIVLADEVNRTSPKTQAALLEAMEEGSITVDGSTYPLPQPFFVMATQNPLEYEGTFPLPEAQLDRFLFKLKVGYPQLQEEVEILDRLHDHHPIEDVQPVMTKAQLNQLQEQVHQVFMERSLKEYLVTIVEKTREHRQVHLGVSPRGSIALYHAAQAFALLKGRAYVLPDDIKSLVIPTFIHRIILKPEAEMQGITVEQVLHEIMKAVPVPVIRK